MSRFDKVELVALAPVVDRKNARVCLVVKLSGLSVPLFKLVSETGNQVLKVHEKTEFPRNTPEDLRRLVARANEDAQSQANKKGFVLSWASAQHHCGF